MTRRVGRYSKQETAELLRLYEEGVSVYKICRTINRSQKSIRNNLIRLGKIKGEITPRRYVVQGKDVVIEDENYFFENFKYFSILFFLVFVMLINRGLNPVETIMDYIYWFFQ
ncbi:MAG: hypothetical protein CBB97_25635 [Candidatus Endolissoclinum sp. TMED37]|nr:MAG: hypothetical protein CBB97_25635 [Candidatus Endolissoclinum sp. TMED37]